MTTSKERKSSLPGLALSRLLALALLAVAFLFAGCETTDSGATQFNAKKEIPKNAELKKGMSKVEVIELLGRPTEIEEVHKDAAVAEIWRYKREVVVSSTIESDGEQERVYADPETGQFITVREPIYRNESVKAVVVSELLFSGDELIAFKETVEDSKYEVGH